MKQAFGFLTIGILFLLIILFQALLKEELMKTSTLESVTSHVIDDKKTTIDSNTKIFDKNKKPITILYKEENRDYLAFNNIPKTVVNAFIAAEDQNFYSHHGVDGAAIIRALLANFYAGDIEQGASTITQQLAKNLYLSPKETYQRKLKEALLAYQLESTLSKQEIIEQYINLIYFQHHVYGIEAASQYYFGKSANKLSIAEAAFLTAIPNNPTYFDPLNHMDHTLNRQHVILSRMKDNNFISEKALNQAMHDPIKLNVTKPVFSYPSYTNYVVDEFSNLVAHKEGYDKRLAHADQKTRALIIKQLKQRVDTLLYKKGVKIYTYLNPDIQNSVYTATNQYMPDKRIESAFVAIDQKTHGISALTGGRKRDWSGLNRAYQSFRQPGSSIKPLLVYGPYINETGASISDTINAGPVCYNTYCPQNYGHAIYGNLSIDKALIRSINTAAVRLFHDMGVETGFKYLERFGFEKVTEDDHRLPSALGGFDVGVSPLELTGAYTTFSSDGVFIRPHAIMKVTDRDGELLYKWDLHPKQIWSKSTNDKMRDILSHVVHQGTGHRAYFPADYIGGKTGTTNKSKDLWFVGLTDHYTAGIWIGYDHPRSLGNVEGRAPHLSIWKSVMSQASK